ncbi:hypothetical protein FWG95_01420 [Candidatus Saccharibacteria bacterium]|nr:hypothetical protein [Candidatus Saccharibacteria bacterium]
MPVREFVWDGISWGGPDSSFILGTTEPTRDNTGAGTDGFTYPTTVVNGNVTVNAGQVYENQIINGYVNLNVGGTLRNCVVRGAATPTDRPIVNVVIPGGWNVTDQAVIDHCTIQPTPASRSLGYSSGVGIKGFRCTRTTILDCIDSFTVSGGSTAPNVTIEGCYASDLVAISPDPWVARPGTHNDVLQHHGSTASYPASSVSVVGNSFDAYPSAGSNVTTPNIVNGSSGVTFTSVMYSRPTGAYSAMVLDRNWMRGGIQTLQCVDTSIVGTLVATGNRWERGTANGGSPPEGLPFVAVYISNTAMPAGQRTWTDNVWLTGGDAAIVTTT